MSEPVTFIKKFAASDIQLAATWKALTKKIFRYLKKLVFKLQSHKFLNFISIVFIQFFPDGNCA